MSESGVIVVPKSTCDLKIAPGSAITAYRTDYGLYCLYYEGNLYDADNLHDFHERMCVAAHRMFDKVVTVASEYLTDNIFNDLFEVVGVVSRDPLNVLRYETQTPDAKKKLDAWIARYAPTGSQREVPC
jgi:hypothetical protein